MSYFLQIGGTGGPTFVASIIGYGDFGRWVDHLDADKYPQVVHLYEWGWCQNVSDLIEQMSEAKKECSPDDSAAGVIAGITELLSSSSDALVVTITDGLAAEGDEGKSLRDTLLSAGYADSEAADIIVKHAQETHDHAEL